MNDKENFEITTLRIDKVCDGRRAEVQYTTDWKLDAYRRDLTINSMFLDGTVYDYTGGIDDVKKRRVAFVGSAKQRIQEDYLRILRYFRFYGRIAKGPHEHEKETIDAITEWKSGLERMSGERVWMELKKILVGRYAGPVIETMLSTCGLQPYLALSSSANVQEFKRVVKSNSESEDSKVDVEPSTSLSALFNDTEEAEFFQRRTKCSNPERQLCEFIFFQDLLLDQVFTSGNDVLKENAHPRLEKRSHHAIYPKYMFDLWKKSGYAMSLDDLLKHSGDEIPEEFCLKITTVIGLGFITLIAQSREIRARYPMTFNHIQFPAQLSDSYELTPSDLSAKRRNPLLSARYKNVFGNSKVVEGSAFIPKTMDAYTENCQAVAKRCSTGSPRRICLNTFCFESDVS
uniref:Poly A polymerase head domain-containing protein n=1 Tax=Ditylenchus dipsaci TaxID=166011 RepID=A0A915D4L8_9BILA